MRSISVEELTPGIKVAKSIYNSQGNILVAQGEALSQANINRLKELGITNIYINKAGEPEVEVPEPISSQCRNQIVQEVKKAVQTTIEDNYIQFKSVEQIVEGIMEEILSQEEIIFHLRDIRNHDNYLFSHLVSVASLSLTIAVDLDYTRPELKKVAVGGLLHDIGLIMIDEKLNYKISQQQHKKYKHHTRYGYDILREAPGISLVAAEIAYQHHEKLDGTGYPRNLIGDSIHDFAQLVAVANIYDKLTNPHPANSKKKLPPHKGLKFLAQLKENKLNSDYVAVMQEHIANYPLGTEVLLNNGQHAIVTGLHQQNLAAPVVKILQEQPGGRVKAIKEVDLLTTDHLEIKRVIT